MIDEDHPELYDHEVAENGWTLSVKTSPKIKEAKMEAFDRNGRPHKIRYTPPTGTFSLWIGQNGKKTDIIFFLIEF